MPSMKGGASVGGDSTQESDRPSHSVDEKRRSRRHHDNTQQSLKTPHGFHERRTVGQMLAGDGVSPGIMSDALLLRAMGTKPPVHHIPGSSSSSDGDGGGEGSGTFHSLPPPPLASASDTKKRGSPSKESGRSLRQRRSLPTAAHRPTPSPSSKGNKKKLPTHRLQSSSKDPKLDAAAALKSLASSSSDSDLSTNDEPKNWSKGSSKSKKKSKKEKKPPPEPPEEEAMLHGVIPISSLTNRSGPMLVDHSYIDYSIVDPDSLRELDDEQGLCPSGFEWEGLNEDPHIVSSSSYGGGGSNLGGKYDDADEDGASALVAEEHLKGPEFEREKAKTIRKLRKMFKGIRPSRRNSGGVVQPFPGKLMEVLDREDIEDILSWMPHGRAFVVKQPKVFTADVLPRFFKQSKYMSFTRQLNLWGFKRITRGRDAGAYYHELFLRGRPRLTLRMRRQKIKGTGIKLTPNPDAEPDFYEMAQVRPLPVPRRGGGGRPKPMPPKLELPQRKTYVVEESKASKSRDYGVPFFPSSGEEAESSPPAAAKVDATASFDNRDGYPEESTAESRKHSEDATASCPKESASSSSAADAEALLAAEMLRQRELAAAELLLGARNESPLEALLRLQAAELKQKQEAVLASQGLLRQLDGIIPGTPAAPANTVAELQQRLLAAARALDQPDVQAAVMAEQRRSQLAAFLASSSPPSLSPLLGGGSGSDLGLLSRLTDSVSTIELLKMRGALSGGSSLLKLGACSTSGTSADGGSASDILGLATALESQKKEDQVASALQKYAAACKPTSVPSSPSAAAVSGSLTAEPLRLGKTTTATEEEVLKVMSTMGTK